MTDNPNCCGSGPHRAGTVKLYPLGYGPLHGNLILCHACWARENQYRHNMGLEYKRPDDWPQHAWNDAEVYGTSA